MIKEYYILAGIKGLKKLLIEKGIDISPPYLIIVKEYSKLGKLIKREGKKSLGGKE